MVFHFPCWLPMLQISGMAGKATWQPRFDMMPREFQFGLVQSLLAFRWSLGGIAEAEASAGGTWWNRFEVAADSL